MRILNPELLARFRAAKKCENCLRPTPEGCDPAHVQAKGMDAGSQLDIEENLVSLCWQCHRVGQHGLTRKISHERLLELVATRLGITASEVQQRIWDALRGER